MLIDYNRTNFDYFIGKTFFLKRSMDTYTIVRNQANDIYFLNLDTNTLYDFQTLSEDNQFWLFEEDEDFIGIYEIT